MSSALIAIFLTKGGRLHHGQRRHQDENLHCHKNASKARRASLHTIHRAAKFPQHEAAPRRTHHFPQRLPLQSVGGGHTDYSQWDYRKKMRLLTSNATLDCTTIAKPDLVNPVIVAETGRKLLNLQDKQLGLWSDYLYQRVLN